MGNPGAGGLAVVAPHAVVAMKTAPAAPPPAAAAAAASTPLRARLKVAAFLVLAGCIMAGIVFYVIAVGQTKYDCTPPTTPAEAPGLHTTSEYLLPAASTPRVLLAPAPAVAAEAPTYWLLPAPDPASSFAMPPPATPPAPAVAGEALPVPEPDTPATSSFAMPPGTASAPPPAPAVAGEAPSSLLPQLLPHSEFIPAPPSGPPATKMPQFVPSPAAAVSSSLSICVLLGSVALLLLLL